MLIIGREEGERIFIDGGRIVVTLIEVKDRKRARIGVQCDRDIVVDREEIHWRRQEDKT